MYIRLSHEMGLERRVTLLLTPLVPSSPPPGTSFWVQSLRLTLPQDHSKMVQETMSCPTSVLNAFGVQFRLIFDSNIDPKSIKNSYLSQAWFQSRFSLAIPRLCVFSRSLKSFKTMGLLFKNPFQAFQNLWSSFIFAWLEFGTKIHQILLKFQSQKYI